MPDPKVFISYAHESPAYTDRVLEFANQLRKHGVNVIIDQFEPHPPEGWPLWMERQLEGAEFVIVLCSERYYLRATGHEQMGSGRGVTWESVLIRNELYDAPYDNNKFIPVAFRSEDLRYVLHPLRGQTNYVVVDFDLSSDSGYEHLYRRLTHQEVVKQTELGGVVELSKAVTTDELAPLDNLPRVTDFYEETRRLNRGIFTYGVTLFVISVLSLLVAYWNAPMAWQLQFACVLGGTSTAQLGSWLEAMFAAYCLSISYLLVTLLYSVEIRELQDAIVHPRGAPGRLPWLVISIGVLLLFTSGWHLWTYHTITGPQKLLNWAKIVDEKQKKPNVRFPISFFEQKIGDGDLGLLHEEISRPDPVAAYRSAYFRYFPYSAAICSLLAVPFCCVMLLGLMKDLKSGWENLNTLWLASEASVTDLVQLKKMTEVLFPAIRRLCMRSINRAWLLLIAAAIAALYLACMPTLATEASQEGLLTLILVFLGPLVSFAMRALHHYAYELCHNAIEETDSIGNADRQQMLDAFSANYKRGRLIVTGRTPLFRLGVVIFIVIMVSAIAVLFRDSQ